MKRIILWVAVAQLVFIVSLPLMPMVIEHYVPGQYWSYLPEWVIATMGQRSEFVEAAGIQNVEVSAADLVSSINTNNPAPETIPLQAAATPLPTPTEEPPAEAAAAEVAAAEEGEAAAAAPSESEAEAETVPPTATAAPPTPTPTAAPPTPTPTQEPLPVAYRIDGMDGTDVEAQKFNNCGPTNLSLVLRFYGDDTDQLEAAAYLKPNSQDRNVSPWQISDYVNEQTGLKSITRSNGNQALLKRLIAADFPVVVEKGYDPPASPSASGWYGHYLTLFGYDDEAEEYYTLDTFLGPFAERDVEEGYTWEDGHPYSYEYMAHYWQQFNYTFYVVYPPGREAELFAILGADLLDDNQMWQGAALRAEEDIEKESENVFAWFNLGTALTRLGEMTGDTSYYENAAVAFDKAISIGLPSRMLWYQHKPYVAYMKTGRYADMLSLADSTLADPGGRNVEETYYYQGHALSLTGDLDGAARAFERALDLNEFFYPAQIALDYVNSVR